MKRYYRDYSSYFNSGTLFIAFLQLFSCTCGSGNEKKSGKSDIDWWFQMFLSFVARSCQFLCFLVNLPSSPHEHIIAMNVATGFALFVEGCFKFGCEVEWKWRKDGALMLKMFFLPFLDCLFEYVVYSLEA